MISLSFKIVVTAEATKLYILVIYKLKKKIKRRGGDVEGTEKSGRGVESDVVVANSVEVLELATRSSLNPS